VGRGGSCARRQTGQRGNARVGRGLSARSDPRSSIKKHPHCDFWFVQTDSPSGQSYDGPRTSGCTNPAPQDGLSERSRRSVRSRSGPCYAKPPRNTARSIAPSSRNRAKPPSAAFQAEPRDLLAAFRDGLFNFLNLILVSDTCCAGPEIRAADCSIKSRESAEPFRVADRIRLCHLRAPSQRRERDRSLSRRRLDQILADDLVSVC
jgi:hypothetical protein